MSKPKRYAPFLDRVIAYFIDSLVLGTLAGLLNSLHPIGLNVYLSTISLFYFIYFHHKAGYTLGKMVMGLKVLDLRTKQPPSLGGSIKREISKILSGLLFMIGYLLPLFSSKSQALHDIMARTVVISFSKTQSKLSTALLVGACSLFLIGSGSIYVFLFTSYPLRVAAKKMELKGFSFEDIEGNLYEGFSYGRYRMKNINGEIELRDLTIEYDPLKIFTERKLHISRISVSSGVLKPNYKTQDLLKQAGIQGSEDTSDPSQDVSKEPAAQPEAFRRQRRSFLTSFVVDLIDINDILLQGKNGQLYSLNRAYFSEINLDILKRSVSTGRVYVDAREFLFDLPEGISLLATNRSVSFDKPMYFELRQAFHKLLNKKVTGELSFSWSKDNKQIRLQAFNNQVRGEYYDIKGRGIDTKIQIDNFEPNQWLDVQSPINSLTVGWSDAEKRSKSRNNQVGEVAIGNQVYPLKTKALAFETGGSNPVLARLNVSPSVIMTPQVSPHIFIQSQGGEKVEDLQNGTSKVYFGKKFQTLSALQKKTVLQNSQKFGLDQHSILPILMGSENFDGPSRSPTSESDETKRNSHPTAEKKRLQIIQEQKSVFSNE